MEELDIEVRGVKMTVRYYFTEGQKQTHEDPPILDYTELREIDGDILEILDAKITLEEIEEKLHERH